MIVQPLGALLALLAGLVFAVFYKWALAPRNPDLWYLGYLLVVVLWLYLLGVQFAGVDPWPGRVLAVDSTVLAVTYALSYALWYRFGTKITFLLLGRRPEEGGSLWIYLVRDYTDEFEPAWRE